jgi:hypothetical protein
MATESRDRGQAAVTNQDAQFWRLLVHNLVDDESYPR